MKIRGLAVLIIFPLVCLQAFPSGQDETTTYTHEDPAFSIEHPASWTRAEISGAGILVIFTGGAVNRNVQVISDKGGEEGGMAALKKSAGILPNFKEHSAEWTDVNGRRVYLQKVEWTSILGGNRAVRLLVPAGDVYYLVMAVCPAEEYAGLESLLERCVLSFKTATNQEP